MELQLKIPKRVNGWDIFILIVSYHFELLSYFSSILFLVLSNVVFASLTHLLVLLLAHFIYEIVLLLLGWLQIVQHLFDHLVAWHVLV